MRSTNVSDKIDPAEFPVYQTTDETKLIVGDMKPLTKYLYAVRIHDIEGYPGMPTEPELLEIPSDGKQLALI